MLLLAGIMLQIWSKPVIFMQYLANIRYIEKTLCINKNDPAKNCHGKCHLKKQLDRDNSHQKDQQVKLQTPSDLISGSMSTSLVPVPSGFLAIAAISSQSDLPAGIIPGIFHPPG